MRARQLQKLDFKRKTTGRVASKRGNGPLVLAKGRSRWAFFQQRTRKKENGRPKDH